MLNLDQAVLKIIGGARTAALREQVEAGGTVQSQFMFLVEETGELSREINRPERKDEGIAAESVDALLSALAVFFTTGASYEDLVTIGERKLAKWNANIDKKKAALKR